jgi:hypothetical protein
MRAFTAAVSCVLFVCVATLPVADPAGAAPGDPVYRPPVDATIVDHFRPPATPYGAGNRGIDYETATGTPIRAAADGVVDFAGPVGTGLHVVVAHPDGLRTSYSFVASVEVVRGQRVSQGDVVATSAGTFHFGVRDGDTYLDPELILGVGHLRLTPAHGMTESIEQTIAYLQAENDGGGWRDAVTGAVSSAFQAAVELGELTIHTIHELNPVTHGARVADAIWTWANTACTPASTPVPVGGFGHDVFVLVAGFGSSSASGTGIDGLNVAGLGIDATSALRFSYQGGRIPSQTMAEDLATIGAADYTADDSQGDLGLAADRLGALIEEVRRVRPGVGIHLIAHSQGGVVAVDAVRDLVELGRGAGIDIVTIGSPHQGATSATMARLLSHSLAVQAAGDAGLFDDALTDREAAKQLSKTSDFMRAHRRAGTPDGVAVTSIGAADDLVVTGLDTHLRGADNILIDAERSLVSGVHGSLPADPAVTTEVGRALHGQHPTCQSLRRALTNEVTADAVATAENLAGAVAIVVVAPGGVLP